MVDNKQYLIDFFTRAVKDASSVKRDLALTNASGINFKGDQLTFTLHGLHQYLFLARECNYAEFKQLLYSSEINTMLATMGAKVIVEVSTGKIDTNTYCLRR